MPKVTLARSLGTDLLKQLGLAGTPEERAESAAKYREGATVDVPAKVADVLRERKLVADPAAVAGTGTSLRAVPPASNLTTDVDESPVSDSNAVEAIEQIGTMRSKDKLQHVIDNDQRVTVKEAAKRRLKDLG